jgi:hypothetical protein
MNEDNNNEETKNIFDEIRSEIRDWFYPPNVDEQVVKKIW